MLSVPLSITVTGFFLVAFFLPEVPRILIDSEKTEQAEKGKKYLSLFEIKS